MSQNIKPINLIEVSKKIEMTVQEHNEALDIATAVMQKAILNDEVASKADEIKALFYGADTLTDDEFNDIYEMALSINEREGL